MRQGAALSDNEQSCMTVELLRKSDLLHDALVAISDGAVPYPGQRFNVTMDACGIAFEHGRGVRSLIGTGLPISATALLRVQFEAVTHNVATLRRR